MERFEESTTNLLNDLVLLNISIGNTTDETTYKVLTAQFLLKFEDLHRRLSTGGQYPAQWITRDGQYQLKDHELIAPISKVHTPKRKRKTVPAFTPITEEQYVEEFKRIGAAEAPMLAEELRLVPDEDE